MTVPVDLLKTRRYALHTTLRLPGKRSIAMGIHWTIGIRSLATVALAAVFAFVISAAVNAQHEVDSTVDTAVVTGPGGTCEFHRSGTAVVAFVTTPDPRPVETSGTYCQIPEGFRSLTLTGIWYEVAAYVGHPRAKEAARANVIKYVWVYPDGSIADGGGVLESMVDVVTAGISFELEWFTATDTVDGTFTNLAEHHDGHFNLARGGTFIRAHLSTNRSPVQYWARQAPADLFLVPEDFRPHIPVVRAVEGVVVDTHGIPVNPPRVIDFEIIVTPDGAVRYQDGPNLDGVGHLAYALDTAWETAISPDRAVLEEIRAAFPDTIYGVDPLPNWGVDDMPLAQWEGVSTDAYGRVTNLDVAAGGGGPLPRSIGQLSALRRLQLGPLGNEQLPDFAHNTFLVPDSLADLAQLEILILNGQSLTDGLVVALSQLANLRWLSLAEIPGYAGVSYSLPPEWSKLRRLEVLDLCPSRVSGHLPPSWGSMTSLKRLRICSRNLEGPLPAAWAQLANLRWLSLSGTGITGPLPPEWSELGHLKVLSVYSDNPSLKGPLPATWGQLANLRLLSLNGTGISGRLPPEWSALRHLEELDLCETGVRGHVPPSWSGMTSLERVDICSRFLDVEGPLPPEWGRMPRLKVYLDRRKVDLTARRQQYFRDLLRVHALEPFPRANPCLDGYVSYVYYCNLNG